MNAASQWDCLCRSYKFWVTVEDEDVLDTLLLALALDTEASLLFCPRESFPPVAGAKETATPRHEAMQIARSDMEIMADLRQLACL